MKVLWLISTIALITCGVARAAGDWTPEIRDRAEQDLSAGLIRSLKAVSVQYNGVGHAVCFSNTSGDFRSYTVTDRKGKVWGCAAVFIAQGGPHEWGFHASCAPNKEVYSCATEFSSGPGEVQINIGFPWTVKLQEKRDQNGW